MVDVVPTTKIVIQKMQLLFFAGQFVLFLSCHVRGEEGPSLVASAKFVRLKQPALHTVTGVFPSLVARKHVDKLNGDLSRLSCCHASIEPVSQTRPRSRRDIE